MSDVRFEVGAAVMCNLGPSGWKLGRIIALHYREDHWPPGKTAPYQVSLEDDHALNDDDGSRWIADAARLLERAEERIEEARVFGPEGHPWAAEIDAALASYRPGAGGADATDWLEAFKRRTTYWCAQVLGGAAPFPPKLRARRADATALVERLPRHNE